METVTLLSGDGGTGKSLLALQLAVACALGTRWIGNDVRSGGAVFVSAEDDEAELHRRLAGITSAQGVQMRGIHRLMLRSLVADDTLLATGPDRTGRLSPTRLFEEISLLASAQRPSLIVLDTLADLFPGNENDRSQARQFIGLLRGLALNSGAAVLLLAHPSQHGLTTRGGTSGSTAWNGSVRSRLYLERDIQDGYEPNPDRRILTTKKANYGPVGREQLLHWKSGVFELDSNALAGPDGRYHDPKAERVFLKLLEEYASRGERLNNTSGANYAPTRFASDPRNEGVTKRALRDAMMRLVAGGKISIAEDGPPSKRQRYLAVASSRELIDTTAAQAVR